MVVLLDGHLYKTSILFPAKGATTLPLQFLFCGGFGGSSRGCSFLNLAKSRQLYDAYPISQRRKDKGVVMKANQKLTVAFFRFMKKQKRCEPYQLPRERFQADRRTAQQSPHEQIVVLLFRKCLDHSALYEQKKNETIMSQTQQ